MNKQLIIIILLVVILLFKVKKLPEIGRALGKAIREFKKGGKEGDEQEPETKDGPTKTE